MKAMGQSTGARLGRAAAALLRPRRSGVVAATRSTVGSAASGAAVSGANLRRAGARAGRHFLGHLLGVLRRLGLQVSAILFLVFGLGFGAAGVEGWRHDHQGLSAHVASLTQMSQRTALELGLALMFIYFGLSSWARAARRP